MPGTLVLFHAHPDDEAITTGGTMAPRRGRGPPGGPRARDAGRGGRSRRRRARTRRDARANAASPRPRAAADVLGVAARRVPRLPRLGHGRRRRRTTRPAPSGRPTSTRPRRAWPRSSSARMRRSSRSTTSGAATAIPTTSRSTAVGVRAAELAGTPRVYESTVDRDHLRDLMRAAREQLDARRAPGGHPRPGRVRRRRRRRPDHHDGRRPGLRRPEAGGHGRAREPDPGRLVLPRRGAGDLRRRLRVGVVHPPRRSRCRARILVVRTLVSRGRR